MHVLLQPTFLLRKFEHILDRFHLFRLQLGVPQVKQQHHALMVRAVPDVVLVPIRYSER